MGRWLCHKMIQFISGWPEWTSQWESVGRRIEKAGKGVGMADQEGEEAADSQKAGGGAS